MPAVSSTKASASAVPEAAANSSPAKSCGRSRRDEAANSSSAATTTASPNRAPDCGGSLSSIQPSSTAAGGIAARATG